jgi:MarR family transcriptional regulator for hemolysin
MQKTESNIVDALFISLDSLSKKLEEFETNLIKKNNISNSSFKILNNCNLPHPITCKEIARKTALSISRASRIIDRLVRDKLLIRKCDQVDRRRCDLSLSEKGEKIRSDINFQLRLLKTSIIKNLDNSKLNDITPMLQEIKNNLMQYPDFQ